MSLAFDTQGRGSGVRPLSHQGMHSATRLKPISFEKERNEETKFKTKKAMPRGDKSSYSGKQKRQAEHIEEGYEKRGVSKKTAKARAWATVNKTTGGGKKSGSGRGKPVNKSPARKGGSKGGAARKVAKKSNARKKG
jgi:plasmid stabilization system protein ParE